MPNTKQGFTLIELMITLAILAIVITMAVPAMGKLIATNRQQALLAQVYDAIQRARSTAVLHRQTIVLCGTTDATTCSSDWAAGWLTRTEATGEILNITLLPAADELRWNGFGDKRIRFHGNGTSPLSTGRFYQCHDQRIAWQLILSRQGRLRLGTAADDASKASLCSS